MKTSVSLHENDAWISDGEEVELSGMLISLMRLSSTQPAECSGCLLTGRRSTKSPLVHKEDICLSYLGRVHEDLCACDHNLCLMIAIEAQYDSVPNAALANVGC